MFGLVFRPFGGGFISDTIYRKTGSGWAKEYWLLAVGVLTGNLGGIIFAIIFRYNGVHYGKIIWIIGAINTGVNGAVSWIAPITKKQIGGH